MDEGNMSPKKHLYSGILTMSSSLGMPVLAMIGYIKVSANLSLFLIHLLVSMLQNDEFDFALSFVQHQVM